jgi:hypothetical protein
VPYPDPIVEIAFNDGPYVASPTWTNVTSYCREATVHRGRNDDFEQFDTGTAQLVLDNRNRLFDPFYSWNTTRTNYVPTPSFETGIGAWQSAQTGAPTTSNTYALFGSFSMTQTMSSTTDSNVFAIPVGTISITSTGTYVASAYVYVPTGSAIAGRTFTANIEGGTTTAYTQGASSPATLTAGVWARVSRLVTFNSIPASFPAIVFRLSGTLSSAVGSVLYLDGVMFEKASTLGTYFDGSTDPYAYGTSTNTNWTGTPHASSSTLTTLTSRVNICSNPSFETDTTNWVSAGTGAPTITRSTAQAFSGTASLAVANTVAGNAVPGFLPGGSRFPVSAGLAYCFSAYFRANTTPRSCQVRADYYDTAGAVISTTTGSTVTNTTTGWTRASWTGTAPTTAVTARIYCVVVSSGVGEIHYIDGVLFEQSATVGTYFDGSTYANGDLTVGISAWTGTTNNSTSAISQFPGPTRLTPRRQIRIRGTANSVTYDVFRGYVAGWPVTWSEAGYDSTVTIQAFDALGLMANETLPTDWPDYYTRSLNPRRYWKCSDSQGTQTIRDSNTVNSPLNLTGAATARLFETDALDKGLIGTSVFLPSSWSPTAKPQGSNPVNTTVSLWTAFTVVPNATTIVPIYYTYQGLLVEFAYTFSTGRYQLTLDNRTTNTQYVLPSAPQNVGLHFVFAITANPGGTPTAVIYQSGQVVTPTSTTTVGSGGVLLEEWALLNNRLQEVSIFDGILTATQVQNLYNYGAARVTETTTARMQRLIGTTDFPAGLQSFTASPAGTVAEIGTGTNVIPEMELVADSEGGELYVSKSGTLTTTNRTDVFNAARSTTSQATFTDDGTALKYGTEIEIQYDADSLKNDVTVTYSGNGEVNVYSDAVISVYGGSSTTIETQLADPTSANQLALMELGVEGVLIPRVSPIDVSVNTGATDWQTILSLELLDRITLKRTPSVGNQFSRDALINSIDHAIVPGVWQTTLGMSMRYTSPFTLDDDILGTLDFNYLG